MNNSWTSRSPNLSAPLNLSDVSNGFDCSFAGDSWSGPTRETNARVCARQIHGVLDWQNVECLRSGKEETLGHCFVFPFNLSIRVSPTFLFHVWLLRCCVVDRLVSFSASFWTKSAGCFCGFAKQWTTSCLPQILEKKSSKSLQFLNPICLDMIEFVSFCCSRLVYTPGHVQADEGEEEVDNEHLKRYITTRRSLDPVFTLPLPTYFRNQVSSLLLLISRASFFWPNHWKTSQNWSKFPFSRQKNLKFWLKKRIEI